MREVKQKVWKEAEIRERDWGETVCFFLPRACEARALRARKTLTPRFTDFLTDFEKKTDCFAVYYKSCLTNYFLCKFKQLSQYASYAMKEAVPQVGN